MNKQFKSIFKEEMEMFMNYKKSCGYNCSVCVYNKYLRLDTYFYESNLNQKIINQQVIDNWLKLFNNCKKSTKYENGLSVMKSFTQFLIQNNYKNIVMPEITIKCVEFIPHIYTSDEVSAIFKYAKYLKNHSSSCRNYDAYYVILSILFGCGLRISEAMHLTLNNIDMTEKTLNIIKSKNNISRIVPMSDSVFEILKEYLSKNEYETNNSRIFLNKFSNTTRGIFLEPYSFRWYFHNVLKHINIQKTYENKYPRVHDIRHTFAINSLEQMQKKGFDLYTSISYLSIYLGHVSIVETEKYLRLVPQFAENLNNQIINYTSSIYKRKEMYHDE